MKRILSLLLLFALCLALPVTAATQEAPALTAEQKESLLSALYEADIASLRRALDLGVVTSQELTAYYLERIDAYNEPYNCFITLCGNALEEARRRDEAMAAGEPVTPLFGIPIVVKDNIHCAGYPTTNGHKLENTEVSTENAEIADRLLSQGAVILGKTNMSTEAQEALISRSAAVGETKNAYGLRLASGGSSGGSAAAVSLNFAAAGLGTDTNSSLRYPAALNGCVSLRPTTTLLPKEGLIILNSTRDTPGAITRTVYDQALLLDALSGGSYTENLNGNALTGLRIGILTQLTTPQKREDRSSENIDPEIMAAFRQAVDELTACGAEVVEVSMSQFFSKSDATFHDSAAMDPLSDYLDETLAENDVAALIYPAYLSAPICTEDENGKRLDVYAQTYITNVRSLASCAGVPEISVPLGTHSRGAGMGLEIVSSRNNEQLLLDMAYSYTQQYDHRVVPEGAPDLHAAGEAVTLAQWLDEYEASLVPAEPEPPEEVLPDEEEAPPQEETPPAQPAPEEGSSLSPWLIAVPAALVLLIAAALLLRHKHYHGQHQRRYTASKR